MSLLVRLRAVLGLGLLDVERLSFDPMALDKYIEDMTTPFFAQ